MTRLTFQGVLTALLFLGSSLTVSPSTAKGDDDVEKLFDVVTVEKGSSAKDMQQTALRSLPLDKLTPAQRQEIHPILANTSLFRRLPTMSLQVEPEVYDYFATHPEAAVSIWQVLEISKFTMTQVNATDYRMDSGDGSKGMVKLLYRTPKQQFVLCKGDLKSPFLLRPIQAHALFHLQTEFSQDKEGNRWATHRLDLFVEFPSQTIETAARMMSPMSNRVMDKNFEEVSLFLHVMSQAMKYRPGWVAGLARKMQGVPMDRKNELECLAEQIYLTSMENTEARFVPAPQTLPGPPMNR